MESRVRVAVIGAGMSGLCMGVKLQEAGIDSFVIFEKAAEVGGTWRDNTYPGLHCDVPSRFYSYSFAPNPEWSRLMPPGEEIRQYFNNVADRRGLRDHIRFGTEVTSAEYRDDQWWITTEDGTEAFDVLVAATGVLRVPRYPDIPGRDSFAGPAFHSSDWDHSIPLGDKRIGLIGTGSTGVQIVTALGGNVRKLAVFQRSPQWVCPWPNPRYSPLTKAALRRWQPLNRPAYWFWGHFVRLLIGRAPVRPGLQRRVLTALCHWNLRLSVRDEALRRKLTPRDQPLCRRLILSGGYYQGIQRAGVEVITEGIDHIEPRGVVTGDGHLHELDMLVYGTGFDARAFLRPMRVVGEGGVTLDEAWHAGPYAYRSVAVPGFPNMFLMLGPHSPIGHQSLIPIAEDQADYAMQWIEQIRSGRVRTASPTSEATRKYNEDIKAALPGTTWTSGCNSWYLGADGLPELFPWVPERHSELLKTPVRADFVVRTT